MKPEVRVVCHSHGVTDIKFPQVLAEGCEGGGGGVKLLVLTRPLFAGRLGAVCHVQQRQHPHLAHHHCPSAAAHRRECFGGKDVYSLQRCQFCQVPNKVCNSIAFLPNGTLILSAW